MKKKLFFLFWLFTLFLQAQIYDPVSWKVEWKKSSATEGELFLKATIESSWHMYGLEIPKNGPVATSFIFKKKTDVEYVGEVISQTKIHTEYDKNFEMKLSWYENEALFVQKIKIDPTVDVLIEGEVNYMVCNEKNCLPPTSKPLQIVIKADPPKSVEAAVIVTKTKTAPTVKNKEAKMEDAEEFAKIEEKVVPEVEAAVVFDPEIQTDYWSPVFSEWKEREGNGSDSGFSWFYVFISGLLGGLFALFTPCVWPIIPMTVSFFLKRSGKKGRRDAILYGASIVVIYLVLGILITLLFGASALNSLSTNAVFNLLFFALLVLFAVSFFGAFDITLPASWSNAIDSKAGQTSGILSIFLMAFTLVLVSFSCTGPIIGTLLVEVSMTGSLLAPAIGMFGFALALAIPFSLFALFPSWLKSAPKSGGWLNSVKVVLGFLELALSLKFLSVADLAYGWGILDREVFLVLWIMIFAFLGFYLLGKIKFSHDSDLPFVSVPRLFLSLISFAFALYMVPGLWGAPLRSISAFSPPLTTQDFNLYNNEIHAPFDDYDLGMAYAAKVGKPVMIDFSGYGCVNCRKMEAAVWVDPAVRKRLTEKYVLITLMVDDKTDLPEIMTVVENGRERKLRTIGDKWSYLQRMKFGANAQPFYVLLDNAGHPLSAPYSYDEDVDRYIRFLDNGLEEYRK